MQVNVRDNGPADPSPPKKGGVGKEKGKGGRDGTGLIDARAWPGRGGEEERREGKRLL